MGQEREKKLKIMVTAVRLQEKQVPEMYSRNEIFLFTNGPGSATEFIELKKKEALEALKDRVSRNSASETRNLEILVDAVEYIND